MVLNFIQLLMHNSNCFLRHAILNKSLALFYVSYMRLEKLHNNFVIDIIPKYVYLFFYAVYPLIFQNIDYLFFCMNMLSFQYSFFCCGLY